MPRILYLFRTTPVSINVLDLKTFLKKILKFIWGAEETQHESIFILHSPTHFGVIAAPNYICQLFDVAGSQGQIDYIVSHPVIFTIHGFKSSHALMAPLLCNPAFTLGLHPQVFSWRTNKGMIPVADL